MVSVTSNRPERAGVLTRRSRSRWISRVSGISVAAALVAGPTQAQLASLRSAVGLSAVAPAPVTTPNASLGSVLTPGMSALVARAVSNEAKASNTGALIAAANAAARAAALALTQTVPDGLGKGALDPVANGVAAADDPTGLKTWQGASSPVQTTSGPATTVTITQTDPRALLSWNSFNIGRNTTLDFEQKLNGVAQTGWVVVNRVVSGIDPRTGLLNPALATPSQILGSIKADGTVLVLNQGGVLFGPTAQVNLHSLLASSLELGAPTKLVNSVAVPTTLVERDLSYLQNGLLTTQPSVLVSAVNGAGTYGDITVESGASINTGAQGFLILAGPDVESAGQLATGAGGQVSLQAGQEVDAYTSTGAATSLDPNVRGLLLDSIGNGTVDVSGSIDAPEGYVSLGASQTGSVTLSGIATLTTSVSRNGKISLTGGTVALAPDAVIAIRPDSSAATIPQSADSVSAFKTSQVEIGSRYYQPATFTRSALLPADITIGSNALILAPDADVAIGATPGATSAFVGQTQVVDSKVEIDSGATIDVSGAKDVQIAASTISLEIDPAKRNELRDTPTYRETDADGFTLNGAILYVDPRITGTRADGVSWVGSPLLEAGSLAAQIGVTASELMTKGGDVTLGVLGITNPVTDITNVPRVMVAADATIDVSGGWVHYLAGSVRTSRLITADGRIVDISQADPNDDYVGVSGGFTENLPQLANGVTYANTLLDNYTYNPDYIEGRDAGTLTIKAPTVDFQGTFHADAFAGSRQIAGARAATATSAVAGDIRKVQADPGQLPSAGLLHIQAISQQASSSGVATGTTGGGNIVVTHGIADAVAGQTTLSDTLINDAGLGGLSLQTSGAVSFAADSDVTLQAGGALRVDAGRTISFDGKIAAPDGTITARTYALPSGSPFSTDDDQPVTLAAGAPTPSLYDIVVNGTLSTAGRWVNDSLVTDGQYGGSAYTNGGSISLTVAPHVAVAVDNGDGSAPTSAVDLSGSILVNQGGLLDVSSGGFMSASGKPKLTATGGNVSLINETAYFQTGAEPSAVSSDPFLTSLSGFDVTRDDTHQSALVPTAVNARVTIAPGSLQGFGFGGGGTFTLVTPDLNFGAVSGASGTAIPIDFIQQTGFANYNLTTLKTDILPHAFDNGLSGSTALLGTEQLVVGSGQTLDLTQAVLPSFLSADQLLTLGSLTTGSDVRTVLAPVVPTNAYDQQAVNLTLGGLSELDVMQGGQVVGAAGSSITASKLYNDGTIRIAGGTITQKLTLPGSYGGLRPAIGVQGGFAGLASVFGAADASGLYSEDADNALGITGGNGDVLSNRDLVSKAGSDRQIYLLGLVGADDGIVLTGRSVTDLSGTSLRNPRAAFAADGSQIITGKLIAGGRLSTLGTIASTGNFFTTPAFGGSAYLIDPLSDSVATATQVAQKLEAASGARIGLAGASDQYDILTGPNTYTPTAEWSAGGTLSALGGGTIAGAVIDAHGGATQAEGGTLEWSNPVLAQINPASAASNVLSANAIMAAGFDNLIARGQLGATGDVSLSLRDSFILRAPTNTGSTEASDYQIGVNGTGALSISANYIRFDSIAQSVIYPVAEDQSAATGSVAFHANAIDVAGAVSLGPSLGSVTLDATGDLRLIGVQALARTLSPNAPSTDLSLSGQLVFGGDATIRAAQVYATTGTGNLQQIADGAASATPYLIASLGNDATLHFERSTATDPAVPYSGGSYLAIQAPHIDQGGVIRAPLGRIDLGSAQPVSVSITGAAGTTTIASPKSVVLESGSITSVSAAGLSIPYGTTTDLTEYFFSPTSALSLTAPPAAELNMAGGTIDVTKGATVDASGGGDLFAYEFVSGVGGSRDVLSRYNTDAFSSTNGYQYADGRQVYAIVPSMQASAAALYDPIYSADYANLYGSDVGKTVYLDAAPGIAAGYYTLLPAHYALLPGGLRVVENTGATAPLPGAAIQQLDGSVIDGGNYGVAGTNIVDSRRLSFTIEGQSTFLKYSNIQLTSASTTFAKIAQDAGVVAPQLPADAARIVLNPLTGLNVDQQFITTPGTGGRGAKVDIAGSIIDILSPDGIAADGGLALTTTDIANLNAASLLIGGIRTDKNDGSTDLDITANAITVATDAANPLQAPELVLAVDGIGSTLTVADGSVISSTGTLTDARSGDYNVAVRSDTGDGALLRVASGTERLVNRTNATTGAPASNSATLAVGAASLTGGTLTLDSNDGFTIDPGATLSAPLIALGADTINFTPSTTLKGLRITRGLADMLGAAQRLTLRSPNVIGFTADGGDYDFHDLVIDAAGIRLLRPRGAKATASLGVTVNAGNVTLDNSSADLGICKAAGVTACGTSGNTFDLEATSLTFGAGTFHTYGFDKSVTLGASQGATYQGVGTLDVGAADLNLVTPYLYDAALQADPRIQKVQPSLTLATTGAVTISSPSGAVTAPTVTAAPGATLKIGTIDAPVASVSITDTLLRATAGNLDIRSTGDIALDGTAELMTPGYSRSFGSDPDLVTVSAGGGALNLVSLNGGIDVANTAKLVIGGGQGNAGSLLLAAADGTIALDGTIDASAPSGNASLTFDSGLSAFDFATFEQTYGKQFTGDVAIRTGAGDLTLAAGQTVKATSVDLTADGGMVDVSGTIDTSGVSGGDISLYGALGVELHRGSLLDAHANGYGATDTRQASGGDIVLGTIGTGSIAVDAGAKIDVGARQTGNRLVAQIRKDPATLTDITAYSFVEADQGGTVTLRAPVVKVAGGDGVNIAFAGTIKGARDIGVEGVKQYDLAAIAKRGAATGVTINDDGQAVIDLTAGGARNEFGGTVAGGVVDFVQKFDISASDGNLGSLVRSDVFHERPNVEIDYSGDIVLASNWNLGAGVVDVRGAVAAGLMRVSPLGRYDTGGQRYEVIPGDEAAVFQRFTSLTYRVGGKVDGEAGVLTLRAGGNLDIEHSITDGFFTFGDQTDPAYINYQLGGGDRSFQPLVQISCGSVAAGTSCGDIVPFEADSGNAGPATSINLSLATVRRGDENLLDAAAPYSARANTPAALGQQDDGAGDPIGSAQLFPLLADGSAVGSFGIQLIGGAGAAKSANPLHIDRASGGSVVVSGQSTYTLAVTPGVGLYKGTLEYGFNNGGDVTNIDQDLLGSLVGLTGLDADTLSSDQTRVALPSTSEARDYLLNAVKAYFKKTGDPIQYFGPDGAPTAFAASLGDIVAFLNSTNANGATFANRYAAAIEAGRFDTTPPATNGIKLSGSHTVRVNTLVRTGTGDISIAAAADVDLRNGDAPIFLSKNGGKISGRNPAAAQAGGSAIYTAGHIVIPSIVTATVTSTGQHLRVNPTAYEQIADLRSTDYIPYGDGELQTNPVYADDGGSISIAAGRDVLGRLDVWSEIYAGQTRNVRGEGVSPNFSMIGSPDQRWRVGLIGFTAPTDAASQTLATNIRINPQQFSSGVGALGGGDVSIVAGRDVSDLTVALDTSVTTADVGSSFAQMTFGGGSLNLVAGGNLLGGRYDIASGEAELKVGGSVESAGVINQVNNAGQLQALHDLAQIRLTDATVSIDAGGSVELAGVAALGVREGLSRINAAGFYIATSGLSVSANGAVAIDNVGNGLTTDFAIDPSFGQQFIGIRSGVVLPASLSVTSMTGDIDLDTSGKLPILMYPSPLGQLSMFAGGTIAPVTLDMDDGDPSLLPGIFTALQLQGDLSVAQGRPFGLPLIYPNTSDETRRLFHNQTPTHAGDTQPVRIAADGSLVDLTLFLPKQSRISAGQDIVNMIFNGQNLDANDITRITAGRDITADTQLVAIGGTQRSLLDGNQFILGGPGTLFVEAGRNLGPFLNSATAGGVSYAGGILTVGNDYNPWLPSQGSSIYSLFGVGKGADFDALRDFYLDPANTAQLDGDLFAQITDVNGNTTPDRTKPIYAPILISWMQTNEAAALTAAYGTTDVTDQQAYTAFVALPELLQREFLLDKVYFNELASTSRPDGPSYLQYIRGYRAVELLFPPSLGYTDNLATYYTDPATITADHPQGQPQRILANPFTNVALVDSNGVPITKLADAPKFTDPVTGKTVSAVPLKADRVETGNLDLRLAAIETERGGDITILAPGGNVILGSVDATSTQAARRAYPRVSGPLLAGSRGIEAGQTITSIPIGYEGVLTLRGGTIDGFADGDVRLNQSRLFTLAGGDITLFSSNGDLNAGQGPKTSANFPPITERFDEDALAEVDSAGSVAGAGIAAFQPSLDIAAPSVTLIAPAGTVDAGDAGVRAAGDVFVAAAQVANADNFKVGGQTIGVPSLGNVATPVVPASATAAIVSNLFKANENNGLGGDQRSRITVDVLGYYDSKSDPCLSSDASVKAGCKETHGT